MSDRKNKKVNRELSDIVYFNDSPSPVFYDADDTYLFKKTERLASAAHIITRHLSAAEPVRKSVRKMAVSLFSTVVTALTEPSAHHAEQAQIALSEFMSMLTIGRDAGFISEQNYSLMCGAGGQCMEHLSGRTDADAPDQIRLILEDISIEQLPQRENSEDIKTSPFLSGGYREDTKKDIKKNEKDTPKETVKKQNGGLNKDDRKAIIKNIIGREVSVSIKDISSVITECSEKTLQRDINELLEEGVIKKEGKRRWSRYLLLK